MTHDDAGRGLDQIEPGGVHRLHRFELNGQTTMRGHADEGRNSHPIHIALRIFGFGRDHGGQRPAVCPAERESCGFRRRHRRYGNPLFQQRTLARNAVALHDFAGHDEACGVDRESRPASNQKDVGTQPTLPERVYRATRRLTAARKAAMPAPLRIH